MTMSARPCANTGCGHGHAVHTPLAGCTAPLPEGGWCPCTAYRHPKPDAQDGDGPATPYDQGTSSGHSGSDASAQRSARRDANGATQRVQDGVLALVAQGGRDGATIVEVRDTFQADHHGTLSGALSVLHKVGAVARLAEQRNHAQVYVLPEHVADRDTVPHGRRKVGGRGRLTSDEAAAVRRVRAIMPTEEVPLDHRTTLGTTTLRILLDALERLS